MELEFGKVCACVCVCAHTRECVHSAFVGVCPTQAQIFLKHINTWGASLLAGEVEVA